MSKFSKVYSYCQMLAFSGVVGILAAGCAPTLPDFEKTQIDQNARGITLINKGERAFGCSSDGDMEVTETTEGKAYGNLATMQEGARNKLRNEAAQTTKREDKIMLRVADIKVTCDGGYSLFGSKKQDYECNPETITPNASVISYYIKAEILNCGKR